MPLGEVEAVEPLKLPLVEPDAEPLAPYEEPLFEELPDP